MSYPKISEHLTKETWLKGRMSDGKGRRCLLSHLSDVIHYSDLSFLGKEDFEMKWLDEALALLKERKSRFPSIVQFNDDPRTTFDDVWNFAETVDRRVNETPEEQENRLSNFTPSRPDKEAERLPVVETETVLIY